MLRLRRPASNVVSGVTANRAEGLAEAGCGAILSALCAMKVPSPIMIAAKIIMLRITPLSIEATLIGTSDSPLLAYLITATTKLRPTVRHTGGNLGEKDERRVNETITSPMQWSVASLTLAAHVPFGLTRRVGIALAGSSGQG